MPLALSHGLQWGQKLYMISLMIFFTFFIQISQARKYDNEDVAKTTMAIYTDKRTDAWWDIFMIWKIDFGLLAVGWAGLW